MQLGHTGAEHVGNALKLGLQMLLILQQVVGSAQWGGRSRIVIFQQLQAGLGRVHQGLRVRQARVLGVELIPFFGARRQLVQLGYLPLQSLSLALQIVLGRERLLQSLMALAPVLPQRLELGGFNTAVGIQHGACSVRAGQALPGMLAMNVDQLIAQMAQLRGRGGRAIDPGAAAAQTVYDAAQQQILLLRKPRLLQPFVQMGRAIELGADIGLGAAFAYHLCIGACAQHQLQGVEHDGFAGAGFAGKHREAGLPVQVE